MKNLPVYRQLPSSSTFQTYDPQIVLETRLATFEILQYQSWKVV